MSEKVFSPAEHRFGPPKYFEDLEVGEEYYIPSRTMNEANFSAFQAVSMDNHPIHYDMEYCRAQGHPGLLAHGLQVLCFTAAGAGTLPHVLGESLMGIVEVSARFLKPVYPGDTLYPMLVVTDLKSQRSTGVVVMRATIHNQNSELVLDGEHRYLVRKKGPKG